MVNFTSFSCFLHLKIAKCRKNQLKNFWQGLLFPLTKVAVWLIDNKSGHLWHIDGQVLNLICHSFLLPYTSFCRSLPCPWNIVFQLTYPKREHIHCVYHKVFIFISLVVACALDHLHPLMPKRPFFTLIIILTFINLYLVYHVQRKLDEGRELR